MAMLNMTIPFRPIFIIFLALSTCIYLALTLLSKSMYDTRKITYITVAHDAHSSLSTGLLNETLTMTSRNSAGTIPIAKSVGAKRSLSMSNLSSLSDMLTMVTQAKFYVFSQD